MNQQGQHISQCKTSFSPEGKAMEDFRGLKNSPLSNSKDDLHKGEWNTKEKQGFRTIVPKKEQSDTGRLHDKKEPAGWRIFKLWSQDCEE